MPFRLNPFAISSLLAAFIALAGLAPSAVASDEIAYAPSETTQIDDLIRLQWKGFGLKASPVATEGEWCRRLFLDVLGRIPSVEELQSFTQSLRHDKRQRLVRKLLWSDRYVPDYARHWTTIWTNLLIGRSGGSERNSLVSRDGMQKYLRDVFAENRSYDQIVVELVTAVGDNAPGTPDFNGAVNFLTLKLDEKAALATTQTARLFLGTRIQCTQCHDHPFNQRKQNQFWELNSFYRQAVALRRYEDGTNRVSHVALADQDFAGEGDTPLSAEVYYERRNGKLKAAYPVFIDGTELGNRSGFIEHVNRRGELARFIVDSDEMPEAIVNRMWAHFLGYGFTVPVDDMGPHNPRTHPELLDYLAKQFVSRGYDLKQLIEWIVLSEAYSLSSRVTKANAADDPSKGEPPMFSHFYLRQMRAEELYESLLVATGADKSQGGLRKREAAKADWLRQFTIAFGTDEGDEGTTFNGTITQTLMMFNGDLMKQALSDRPGSMLQQLVQQRRPLSQKIDHLFLAALSRQANRHEVEMAKRLIGFRGGNTMAGLQDLWWAVLNSNEFIFNH